MNTSARAVVRIVVVPLALTALLAACSSSSTPAPAANTPAPTVAAPSLGGGGSISIPSLSLGSFNLNQDTDLEAKLPSTFCGVPVQKLSMSGADVFSGTTDPTFAAALQALGKQPSDVAFAYGNAQGATDPTCSANFVAFQIKGVDPGTFKQILMAAATKDGDTVTEVNLGGKDVVKDVSAGGGSTSYFYFSGDTALGVQADTDDAAAKGLAAMP